MREWIINILAVIGGIFVFKIILWPIIESIIFGHMYAILTVLNLDSKPFFKKEKFLKNIVWLLILPWQKIWHRLGGNHTHTSEIEQGKWIYRPPLKLKIKKKNR